MTREEAESLVRRAQKHLGKFWVQGAVEYEFIDAGQVVCFKEETKDNPNAPFKCNIQGTKLVSKDGRTLNKLLQEIVDYFEQ